MDYLSIACNVIYYIGYPLFYVLGLILYLVAIVTAPLQHLAHYFAYACWYPIRVLAKFETLYIFFGVAVLIGVVTGIGLHYVSSLAASVLNLESHAEEWRGRSLHSYRAERRHKLEERDPLLKIRENNPFHVTRGELKGDFVEWERQKKHGGRPASRLVPNIILEEDSTDETF